MDINIHSLIEKMSYTTAWISKQVTFHTPYNTQVKHDLLPWIKDANQTILMYDFVEYFQSKCRVEPYTWKQLKEL